MLHDFGEEDEEDAARITVVWGPKTRNDTRISAAAVIVMVWSFTFIIYARAYDVVFCAHKKMAQPSVVRNGIQHAYRWRIDIYYLLLNYLPYDTTHRQSFSVCSITHRGQEAGIEQADEQE